MWIDGQGVCHSVALPDPTTVMSTRFRASLDRLISSAGSAILDLVEAEESCFHDEIRESCIGRINEMDYVEVPAPKVLTEPVETIDDLQSLIRGVEGRWRLDALMALDDYLS